MANEDFTSYIELDPAGKITKTASKVDAVNVIRSDGDAYVYDDKGVDYVTDGTDFEWLYEYYMYSASGGNGQALNLSISDKIDDGNNVDGQIATSLMYGFSSFKSVTARRVLRARHDGGSQTVSEINILVDTLYYESFQKDNAVGANGTLYNYLYTDSNRTNLAFTLTLTLSSTQGSLRYLYPFAGWARAGQSFTHSSYLQNLDLQGVLDSTTVGVATAVDGGSHDIDVSMPYTDDNNTDSTYTIDYKLSSSGSWINWVTNASNTPSPYTDTITGLVGGETYDVRCTYNDADGVTGTNPQTISNILIVFTTTTVGVATATDGGARDIDVSMPYTDDTNDNNTYTIDYRLSADSTYINWVTGASNTPSPYTDTITGLDNGAIYDVRVTYNDTDGVIGTNPQTISSISLSAIPKDFIPTTTRASPIYKVVRNDHVGKVVKKINIPKVVK